MYFLFLFFSPSLFSGVVSMVKDGERDKTQMVNKCTFDNNNNANNDDDCDDSTTVSPLIPPAPI